MGPQRRGITHGRNHPGCVWCIFMNTHLAQAKNIDEEWILKYRAALQALPSESPGTRRLDMFCKACRRGLSIAGEIMAVEAWSRRGKGFPKKKKNPPGLSGVTLLLRRWSLLKLRFHGTN
jgi:hypothetical protein